MKKGITLVALVVTIIILLLLAGVTISLSIGPSGILEKSKESKLESRYASIKDKVKVRESALEVAFARDQEGEHQKDFIERLEDEGLITSDDEYDNVNYRTISLGKQSDGSYKYVINIDDGTIEGSKIAKAINSLPDADLPGNEHLKNLTLIIETKTANEIVTLPINNTADLTINWDAKNSTTFANPNSTSNPTYIYPAIGTYEVQIAGECKNNISFGSYSTSYENKNIVGLKHWGENGFSNFYSFGKNLRGAIPIPSRNSFRKTNSFNYTFYFCTGLTENIPAGLFANSLNVKYFNGTFNYCTGLRGNIPARLFANCSNVTSFSYTFSGCSALTGSIPAGLFDNCPNVTSFSYTFFNCSALTGSIPTGLFDNCPNVTTFDRTFYNCSNIEGVAPDLWNRTNSPIGTYCFRFCNKLSNYGTIDSAWK